MVFCSGCESGQVFHHLFIHFVYVFRLEIQLSRGEGGNPIIWSNSKACAMHFLLGLSPQLYLVGHLSDGLWQSLLASGHPVGLSSIFVHGGLDHHNLLGDEHKTDERFPSTRRCRPSKAQASSG